MRYIDKLQSHDELAIVSELGKIFTGLDIEDWNDTTCKAFINNLDDAVAEINKCNNQKIERSAYKEGTTKIVIGTKEAYFVPMQVSSLGEQLLNNIENCFGEFNESIEPNEKINILLKLMEKIIGK